MTRITIDDAELQRAPRTRRAIRLADPLLALAAAGAGFGNDCLGEAREPLPDRGIQGTRRTQLSARPHNPHVVDTVVAGAARIVQVTDQRVAEAMTLMYRATHNLPEGAAALGLAAPMSERDQLAGLQVALIHTGSNVDFSVLAAAFSRAGASPAE